MEDLLEKVVWWVALGFFGAGAILVLLALIFAR